MRAEILKRAWRAFGPKPFARQSRGMPLMIALLLAAANVLAAPTANWVSGGPNTGLPSGAGYADGDITLDAEYYTPCGIAFDFTGQYLFVADRDNNAIRFLDFAANWTWTFAVAATNLVNHPIGVAVDTAYNVYVLNRGNGNNGSVVTFDNWGDVVLTNTTGLTNAGGMALDTAGNIYVTASNRLFRITGTTRTLIATVANAGASLKGIAVKRNGLIAACDSGRNGIYLIDPTTGNVTTNAGFHGAGDFTTNGNNMASASTAKFNQPMSVAEAGDGSLVVTDYGNHRVKRVLTSGVVTNLYGVTAGYWVKPYKGFMDGTVVIPDKMGGVAARMPNGVTFAPDGSVYVSEDYYHIIRHITGAALPLPPPPPPAVPTSLTATATYGRVDLTWTASGGATNYNVKRSPSGTNYTIIGTTTGTTYTDTNVLNGATYYYVVSALGPGGESADSAPAVVTVPNPPVTDPQIGWVDFPPTSSPYPFTSVFHPTVSAAFNNDVPIVIVAESGTLAHYTYGNYTNVTDVPDPTLSSASAPGNYTDGLYPSAVGSNTVASILPYLSIKAFAAAPNRSDSATVSAQFQFIVASPLIVGDNAAQFSISNITASALMYYTTDGSDPGTNSLGPITNGTTLSLNLTGTSLMFKIRGFRANYQPSGIASNLFLASAFNPNTISFGFNTGEASSDFIASPGQTFYAPVALLPLSNTKIYSLQFNLTVTNGGPNPGPALALGAYNFESMLIKPIPSEPEAFEVIPPWMYEAYDSNPPPPPLLLTLDGFQAFVSLITTNSANNLIGVGWVERLGATNLYNTKNQDLIKYSQAHDNLFLQEGGKVILGGYNFTVPANATNGQTYQIQIGRPTATSDGIGTPGSAVFISAPTNGSLAGGAINAIKNVTIGQRKYLAGNAYPFRWFNAGDFGNTNLQSADVEQVYQSAVYGVNSPAFQAPGSDFFDSLDSCGYIGVLDGTTGYYTNSYNLANPNLLFDGNNTTINQIAFGDGQLDVADVYVTYRRALDPTLTWYQRFWTNGVRAAEIAPNIYNPKAAAKSRSVIKMAAAARYVNAANQPKVVFTAGDVQASAGSMVSIPITASVFGNYPLRLLLLNLRVVPLDGSPALKTPVSFAYNPALGAPRTTAQRGNGNYSAAWLNDNIPGLSNNVTIGTLYVTVPTNAIGSCAYAVHFDHVSASPNGMGSFPKTARTGLITLADRSSSSHGDGIPDSWRLRYFLTLNNVLSETNADADGDGLKNLQEYAAGTDPTDPASLFKNIGTEPLAAQSSQDCVISWPSVIGKQYVIERSPSLSTPVWNSIATNSGNGTVMEYHDATGGGIRFYRVRVQ
jgi:sugar lactone lactonase YvrE